MSPSNNFTYTITGVTARMNPYIRAIEDSDLRYECTIDKNTRVTSAKVFDKINGKYDPLEVSVTCSRQDVFDAGVGMLIAIGKWHIVDKNLRINGEQEVSWRKFKEWANDNTYGPFTFRLSFNGVTVTNEDLFKEE